MKKVFYLLIAISLILFSCSAEKQETDDTLETKFKTEFPEQHTDTTMAGADKDEHGCLGSAGFTWSVIKNNCIRVWETGIQLQQIDKTEEQTSVAAIIIAKDEKQIELFIADETKSILLDKQENTSTYSANDYLLTKNKKGWILSKNKKEIYSNY